MKVKKKTYLKYKQNFGQVTSNFFVQLYDYSRFVSTILSDVMVERTFLHAIRQILKWRIKYCKIWLKILKKFLPGENFLCLRIAKSNFRPFCGAKKQSFPYQWHSWWLWSDWCSITNGIGKATSEKRPLGTLTEASLSAAKLAQKYLIIPPNDPTQHPHPEKKKNSSCAK